MTLAAAQPPGAAISTRMRALYRPHRGWPTPLAVLPLLLAPPTRSAWGPDAQLAIFNPSLGESLRPTSGGAVDVHFGVVGPPAEAARVAEVCFETIPGHNLSAAPSALPGADCVPAHPGKHDSVRISGLEPGPHTLLAAMRWKEGQRRRGAPGEGHRRTFFALLASSRSPAAEEGAPAASFLATTRRHAGESSARVMAYAGAELMFRSSGSSNYGANYPGFWFPTAGICPRSFLQARRGGGGGSFHDVLRNADGSTERLRAALGGGDMIFDKRFAAEYSHRAPTHPTISCVRVRLPRSPLD